MPAAGLRLASLLGVGLSVLSIALLGAPLSPAPLPQPGAPRAVLEDGAARTLSLGAASEPTNGPGLLNLSASATPSTVCAYGAPTCPGVGNETRVTLRVAAPADRSNGSAPLPVEVLFLVETSLFDGNCASDGVSGLAYGSCPFVPSGTSLYNLSLFLPDFLAHSGSMTQAVVAAHPGASVSFGLVDFQQAYGSDDGDGWVYHVDVGTFVNATAFPAALNRSTLTNSFADMDGSDNMFRSSSITALYGGLQGEGINWSTDAAHVLVWIGTTAPRDPGYPVNYCVPPISTLGLLCIASTCEPSTAPSSFESPFSFAIPACEGWVRSSDGNASHSLSALAYSSPSCWASLLYRCLIDTITLPSASTDPGSWTWRYPNGTWGMTGRLQNNTASVLAAGCDLANATGGSWDGPVGTTCGGGVLGSIPADVHNVSARQAQNVSLIAAVGAIGFGPPPGSVFVEGAPAPMVRYVLAPGVSPAPQLNLTVTCTAPDGTPLPCDPSVQATPTAGGTVLSWNWSSVPENNSLARGDTWSASFDLLVDSPPNGSIPLSVCRSASCASPLPGQPESGATFSVPGQPTVFFEGFPGLAVSAIAPPNLSAELRSPPSILDLGTLAVFGFSAAGGVPPYSTHISFGDGSSADWSGVPALVSHLYGHPGAFRAGATIGDANGSSVTLGTSLSVLFPMDLAMTTPGVLVGVGTPNVYSVSVTGGLPPYRISWDYGDGIVTAPADGPVSQTLHTYDAVGIYHGGAWVYDATGALTVGPFDADVMAGSGSAGGVALTATSSASVGTRATTACSGGVPVQLFGNASGGTGPYEMSWAFGDGTMGGTGSTVLHQYAAGTYTAYLTVTDANGTTAQSQVTITVPIAFPPAGCSGAPSDASVLLRAGEGFAVILVVAGVVLLALRYRAMHRRR